MVERGSTMLPLGTKAPEFNLENAVDGRRVGLSDFADRRALLVMFICNHCPYVIRVRDHFPSLDADYSERGLGVVAINSNSLVTHPQDGPEHMKALVKEKGWRFPFLFDATQEVAKAYRAACTPDFFLFDGDRKLVYRGQLDEARPGNDKPVTGSDLRRAIECVFEGREVPKDQKASIGCNIKWTPGNAPDYFG